MRNVGMLGLVALIVTLGGITKTNSTSPSTGSAHESFTSAATLYARHCAKCHGRDGSAKGIRRSLSGARDLTDPAWQDRVSDERIFNVISNGKGKMPAFSKKMSEAEIDSLVEFVRRLRKEK
ncbi:MAG TPA: cytochrome c [Pyrinomonadaceae bacterium]|nr:cytochrome c [Pyrinomonadaceae bacterium]